MVSNKIAFANLRAEMARKGLTIQDIATLWGVNRDTASRKLSKKNQVKLNEAFAIEKEFFPGLSVRYLFHELEE